MSKSNSNLEFSSDLKRFLSTLIYLGVLALLLFALFMMLAMFRISSFAFNSYDNIDDLPYHRVGLLLGTSPKTANGQDNLYFSYRILAATQLYQTGKIKYILVSGDNRHKSYNEPRMMYQALIKAGIPAEAIIMDFAGISTLDSVIRASRVFMLQDLTIITQGYHNERALFIASHYDLKADGYNAPTPPAGFDTFKVDLREFLARIKCIFDIYFFETLPRFLGEPEPIGNSPMPKMASNKPRLPSSKPKQPTLSYRGQQNLLLEQLRQNSLPLEERAEQNNATAIDLTQQSLLEDAQQQALQDAQDIASMSFSQGQSTYIDPHMQPQPQEQAPAEPAPTQRRRRVVPNPHGDPWDYY